MNRNLLSTFFIPFHQTFKNSKELRMKTRKNYFLCKRETKIESYMKLLQSVRIK